MKREYKNKSIVSGMKVEDILNVSNDIFNKWTAKELKSIVGRLVSAGNKRYRRMEKQGLETSATKFLKSTGGPLSTKNKDLNDLRHEFIRAKKFLESKSSSLKEYKKFRKETIKGFQKQGIKVTESNFDKLIRAYDRLKELDKSVAVRGMKYSVLKEISDTIYETKGLINVDEIVMKVQKDLDGLYRKGQELEVNGDGTGVSGFIQIE